MMKEKIYLNFEEISRNEKLLKLMIVAKNKVKNYNEKEIQEALLKLEDLSQRYRIIEIESEEELENILTVRKIVGEKQIFSEKEYSNYYRTAVKILKGESVKLGVKSDYKVYENGELVFEEIDYVKPEFDPNEKIIILEQFISYNNRLFKISMENNIYFYSRRK